MISIIKFQGDYDLVTLKYNVVLFQRARREERSKFIDFGLLMP